MSEIAAENLQVSLSLSTDKESYPIGEKIQLNGSMDCDVSLENVVVKLDSPIWSESKLVDPVAGSNEVNFSIQCLILRDTPVNTTISM